MKHLMLFEEFANESSSKPFRLVLTIISEEPSYDIEDAVLDLLSGIGCENVQFYQSEYNDVMDASDIQQIYTFEGDCADVKQFSKIKNEIDKIFIKCCNRRADDMNINGVDLR
jgi:hypothetical protein